MTGNKWIKWKPYLLITAVYLLSQFFLLILSGCWWDDWTFMSHNLNYIAAVASESGRPEWNLLIPFCWSLTNNGRILIFFLYYCDALLLYDILKCCGLFKEKEALFLAVVYILIPVNEARLLISNFAYTTGLFIFYLAADLFIRWNASDRKLIFRILLLALFFCSLILNSLLTYYFIIIFYLFLRELQKSGKTDLLSLIKAVFAVLKNYPDFFVLPFVYFAFNKFFFPTHGEVFGHYNSINLRGLIRAILLMPETVFNYALLIAKEWLSSIDIIAVILITILAVLIWREKDEEQKDWSYAIKTLLCGCIILVLALLPYLAIRGKPLELNGVQGRDSILVPFGLSLLIYAAASLFPGKIRKLILIIIIVLGISSFNDLYLEWQKDYYYQLAMEECLDQETIRNNDTFFLADLNETEVGGQRFYSLNTNAYNVFGDETRLFIPKVANLYLLEDEDALDLTIRALDHAYVMKDYEPEDLYLDAVIVYECELSDRETVKLKYREMFDHEGFLEEISQIGELEVYPVEDDFTVLLLERYDQGLLHGDEDVLELLQEQNGE